MKRLFSLCIIVCLFVTLQAQTYTPSFNSGDTVTIRLGNEWDSLRTELYTTYLAANHTNGIYSPTEPNDDCLWVISIELGSSAIGTSYYYYTFRNITTQKSLSIAGINTDAPWSSTPQLMLSDQATVLYLARKRNTHDVMAMGKMFHRVGTTDVYLATENAGVKANMYFTSQFVLIEKWTQRTSVDIMGYFTPEKHELRWGDTQPINAQFVLSVIDSSFMVCNAAPNDYKLKLSIKYNSNVQDANTTFHWESNKGASLTSTSDPSKFYGNPPARAMMAYSSPQQVSGATKWNISISPVGECPMDLQNSEREGLVRYVDYIDRIVAEFTYNNVRHQRTMRVVRKSYHHKDLPQFEFSITPNEYIFPKSGGPMTMHVECIHQHGSALYNIDEHIIPETKQYTFGPESILLDTKKEGWKVLFNFVEEDLVGEVDWLSYTISGNDITITAEANGRNSRTARLLGHFEYTNPDDPSDSHYGEIHPLLKQSGNSDLNNIELRPTENGFHTAQRTIYYRPHDPIAMQLAESSFYGYMRWYDLLTGRNPYYNTDEQGKTSWHTFPKGGTGIDFLYINHGEADSKGVYGAFDWNNEIYILDYLEESRNNPTPILYGWPDNKEHIMACNVSAYIDFGDGITNKVIQEPTLSYRQLFYMKPAQQIADSFAIKSAAGKYLEVYQYLAPTDKNVYLSTNFRHSVALHHESELCYFYEDASGNLQRIGEGNVKPQWYRDGQLMTEVVYPGSIDYLQVSSQSVGQHTYDLRLSKSITGLDYDLLIARFVVDYVDVLEHGPSSIKPEVKSRKEIERYYEILDEIDFSFGAPAPGTDEMMLLNHHLPWDEATYGFVYPEMDEYETDYVRYGETGVFPFYGEYCILNKVDKDWAKGENHGGAKNGYALYVDGTMEPGVVATVSTDAVICSGQTMYCSAWFCNPAPIGWTGANPVFRCNVQGRNIVRIEGNDTTYTQWQDVGAYFVGELPQESGWQQVNFPIVSSHNYDQSRVCIYNFATTNWGNDFLVDDICLYVSQIPLAAYQAKAACSSDSHTAAVLRVDYTSLEDGAQNNYVYYQIYNETNDEVITLDNYYKESNVYTSNQYGSVRIPNESYVPSASAGDKIYTSIAAFVDDLTVQGKDNGKCYILTRNQGVEKWLLYIVHILDWENSLDKNDTYLMRMAYQPKELSQPSCAMQTPIPVTQKTVVELHRTSEEIISPSLNNCPNDRYTLDVKVKNFLAEEIGAKTQDIEAPSLADWLVGYDFDYVYGMDAEYTDAQKLAADAKFKQTYGYSRGEVTTAIMYDMRRLPTQDIPNPNYLVTDFNKLQLAAFVDGKNYTIIKDLHDKGLLELGMTKKSFYLPANAAARYWVFPIEGTAQTTIELKDGTFIDYTLQDCNEPKWVDFRSSDSEFNFNILPIDKNVQTEQQKLLIPNLRVKASEANKCIALPMNFMTDNIRIGWDSAHICATNDPNLIDKVGKETFSIHYWQDRVPQDACQSQSPYKSGDIIYLRPVDQEHVNDLIAKHDAQCGGMTWNEGSPGRQVVNTDTLRAGYEYLMRIALRNRDDNSLYIDGEGGCRVGYIYVNIVVMPDVMMWKPKEGHLNGWQEEANWVGIVDGKEVKGYVPVDGTTVIIPKQSSPLLYPALHEHTHNTTDIHYQTSNCGNIYFGKDAFIQNQHLLQYDKAYVDMPIMATNWNSMSVPLKDVYAGDLFVPHNFNDWSGATLESTEPFVVSGFQGARTGNAPYAFWASFYNKSINIVHENNTTTASTATAAFVEANALDQRIEPATGFQLLGFGPKDDEVELTIRLPKPDTKYYYYYANGTQSSIATEDLDRDESHKLAFDPADGQMTITLTNDTEGSEFMFGNPTMAYIDMYQFLYDNQTVLQPSYKYMLGGAWKAASGEVIISQDRFLAPMRSVMLTAKNPGKSITVMLKPDHTTLDNRINYFSSGVAPAWAPRKASATDDATSSTERIQLMHIYMATPDANAGCKLAISSRANDDFVIGEDALFVSSGVEAEVSATTACSPLNMYTVANSVPMLTDVRKNLNHIPLSMLVHDDYRTDDVQIGFYLSPNWNKTCYFCDSVTGKKIKIMNGLVIQVPMIANHASRYYIEGPDPQTQKPDDGITTDILNTPMDNTTPTLITHSPSHAQLQIMSNQLMREVKVYDLTGRVVATKELSLLSTQTTMTLPTGVYIVEALLTNDMKLRKETIVQ